MKNRKSLSIAQYLMISILPPIITEILVFAGIQRTFWLHFFSFIMITVLVILYNYARKKTDHTP